MSDERHRNCHTCERDYAEYLDDDGNSVHHCRRPFAAQAWLEATPIDDIGMPPTETEPCPGWEAREVVTP